jgi:hypothetical protein
MKKITKLFLAFVMAMGALSVFAADHYVYFDGTYANPKVWAWVDGTTNCTTTGAWPGDAMTKKDGKWYWKVPVGKLVPLQIIFNDGNGGQTKDLKYVDKATYHQDGSYTEFIDPSIPNVTASPASGTFFKDGESITVTLEVSMEATIYYTTDGTEPTKNSAVYSEPLEFTESTTLKTFAVTAEGKEKTQSFSYTKMPAPGEGKTGPSLNTNYYQVNPNGQVGTKKTIDMAFVNQDATNAMKHWEASDIIAQGVARDVCQAMKGKHERPIIDSYAVFAAYDDENLYLGVQLVYMVWDQWGEGQQPGESKPHNMNGRMMWAFDLSPVKEFDGYIDGKAAIWNQDNPPTQRVGAKFANGVDAIWIGSSQPGVPTPGFFLPTPDGHASYSAPYCPNASGVKYGKNDNLHPCIKNIYGQSSFEYNPSVLTGNTGFVDLKSEIATTAHTFYEWKFPLSLLGVSADYIAEYGIGVMYIDIYGCSPVGGTPYDPSYFDNVKKSYSMDPSSSMEKEDEDVITYAPARIGKLLKPADPDKPETDTPIDEVEAEDGPAEYFTITGVKIAEPVEGQVVIERRGSKVVKKVY